MYPAIIIGINADRPDRDGIYKLTYESEKGLGLVFFFLVGACVSS